MKKLVKGLLCAIIPLSILSACGSDKIVGTWVPVKDCPYRDTELTFTKEGTVQLVDLDENVTIGGKYEKNTDNVYTFNLNTFHITGTLHETTLDILGGGDGDERCTFKKKKD
ncbi:hypothetical protein NKR74_05085 [Bacillus sp. 3103sda1]|uniref:hypothetical protein n=1 Tax=Bacillus sp. 3103sda1 TaxID=2953808 RepID=UPI0020A1811F|nr:hypothetical protein [Bacillus sp. 3103sda1]MCP1122720.1 hypothetical protein [Bacillus sp. 3103sda1]